jgi:hypothetical protein
MLNTFLIFNLSLIKTGSARTMAKRIQPRQKKRVSEKEKNAMENSWSPPKMVEALLESPRKVAKNWSETGLPQLVDEIMKNYEAFGGMGHLEGRDLPSKKDVIEVLEDLLTVFFPGYLGQAEVTKTNIKYFLGNTLASVQTRLTEEVEKSLKYICRKIKECPHDVCHQRAALVVKELLEKIPELRSTVSGDILAAYDGDPAAVSTEEVIIS